MHWLRIQGSCARMVAKLPKTPPAAANRHSRWASNATHNESSIAFWLYPSRRMSPSPRLSQRKKLSISQRHSYHWTMAAAGRSQRSVSS